MSHPIQGCPVPEKTQMTVPCPYPSLPTLRKYGLTHEDWFFIGEAQDWTCPACSKPLVKPVIDHQHVRGWKRMPPQERRKHVRGLLHRYCNRFRVGKLSLTDARAVVSYLEAHERRRHDQSF